MISLTFKIGLENEEKSSSLKGDQKLLSDLFQIHLMALQISKEGEAIGLLFLEVGLIMLMGINLQFKSNEKLEKKETH